MFFINWPVAPKEENDMKQFRIFVIKEFYHVFRDSKSLLLLFGMPIAQILLFGFALTNEIKNSNIVVFDQAHDPDSEAIVAKLAASTYFDLLDNVASTAALEEAFLQGGTRLAVIIPAGFGHDLGHTGQATIQTIADASDPNTATSLTNYVNNIIRDYETQVRTRGQAATIPIQTEVRMLYNPELKGATNFVPGVISLVLLLVCVLMTSVSIVREKERGTMEVLLVSPMHPMAVIMAKAAPYFALSLVNLTIILLMSFWLLDMPMNGSLLLLYAESGLFILCALSLGLLISNSTNSQQTAMLVSLLGMLLPTLLFTGFMFPLENMPWPLQVVANIVPSKWYYIIVKAVMIKGVGIGLIWKETLILAGITLLLLALSFKKFNIRLT